MARSYTLYVHPAAFALPSIDPDSTASILYLARTESIPIELLDVEYQYSSFLNEKQCLPALKAPLNAGSDVSLSNVQRSWYTGFISITSGFPAERSYDELSQARTLALLSHLRIHLRPLFAYHFYASHENYFHHVRPAWSTLLPSVFHSYAFTPSIRDSYVELAEQFGLYDGNVRQHGAVTASAEQARPSDGWAFSEHQSSSNSLLFRQQNRLSKLAKAQVTRQRLRKRIANLLEGALLPARRLLLQNGSLGVEVESLLAGYIGTILWTKPAFEDRIVEEVLREDWPDILSTIESAHSSWQRTEMHALTRTTPCIASANATLSERFVLHASTLGRALLPEQLAHTLLLARLDGFTSTGLVTLCTAGVALASSAAWYLHKFWKGFGYGSTRMVFARASMPIQNDLSSRHVLGALFGRAT